MDVKISFVIPTYNAERTVRETVESILSFSLPFEIIVADDGSEDRTREIVSMIGDDRVRLLACPRGGVSRARNAGLAEAKGEYVHFTDADDLVRPEGIRAACEAAGDADIVMFAYGRTDSRREAEELPLAPGLYREKQEFENLKRRLLDVRFASRYQSAYFGGKIYQYLFKREFLVREGLHFPEGLPFAEDCVFLYDCFGRYPEMLVTDVCGYTYKSDPESVSHRFRPNHWEEYKDMLARLTKIDGKAPHNAARLIYQNGTYVMQQAVLHFGRGDTRAAEAVIRQVISDPVYRDALRNLHYHDFTCGEKLRNCLAGLGLAGLYGRWVRRTCGI